MIYTFANCVLDTQRFVLLRAGETARVEPQVFAVLAFLVEQHGRLVTKEELFDQVWGRRFVSDAALTSRIRAARKSVGDTGARQGVIRTVHGKGYELIAPVAIGAAEPGGNHRSAVAEENAALSPSTLPVAVQALVGRDALLSELAYALKQARLLTLVGPGGVGKTTLAFELARNVESLFRDGIFAIELVSVRGTDAMVGAVATALHIQALQGESLADTVIEMLRPRQILLLIDNCEHLVEPLAVCRT